MVSGTCIKCISTILSTYSGKLWLSGWLQWLSRYNPYCKSRKICTYEFEEKIFSVSPHNYLGTERACLLGTFTVLEAEWTLLLLVPVAHGFSHSGNIFSNCQKPSRAETCSHGKERSKRKCRNCEHLKQCPATLSIAVPLRSYACPAVPAGSLCGQMGFTRPVVTTAVCPSHFCGHPRPTAARWCAVTPTPRVFWNRARGLVAFTVT